MKWKPYKQLLPAPRNMRDVIQYFVLYNEDGGLLSVLQPVDCSSLKRAQIMRMVTHREPGPPSPGAVFHPTNFLKNVLSRNDTMQLMRNHVASAYEEKRRRFFIHIPKCAGTDLTDGLRRLSPMLREKDFKPGVTLPEEMYYALREFAIGINYSDTISFSGHERLHWYRTQKLIRPQDEVFTTLRDPVDIVFSFVSYVLTIFEQFRDNPRRDMELWLSYMGLEQLPPWPNDEARYEFGRQVLRCPLVVAPERITYFLGECTAQSAFDAVIETDIEITDTQRYDAWRQAKFGSTTRKRINASEPYFTRAQACKDDLDYAHDITAQDRIFYDRVSKVLEASGELSIRGRSVGAPTGPVQKSTAKGTAS